MAVTLQYQCQSGDWASDRCSTSSEAEAEMSEVEGHLRSNPSHIISMQLAWQA